MAERLPSLELIADEVRFERDAQFRHVDAVDAKAGVVLDTHVAMIEKQRELLQRNTVLLGRALVALLVAAVLLVAGTMVEYLGG